jgi:hypothetical protein
MILCLAALIGLASASTGKEDEHQRMWGEIDACVEFLNHVEIPEKCRAWLGNPPAAPQINRKEARLSFCKNKVYFKYLSQISGMFAHDTSIGVPADCVNFISHYEPFSHYSSIDYASGSKMVSFGQKALVMGRALRLLQKLHQVGFSHGNIAANAFGTDFQLLYASDGVKIERLRLGHLMDVRSVYSREGDFTFEGAMAQKKDLLNFANKVVPVLFPGSRIAKRFLHDVETTEIDASFPFSDWQDTLRALQVVGTDSRLLIPTQGIEVFSLLESEPVKDWVDKYSECVVARSESALEEVSIRPGTRFLMSEKLGLLEAVVGEADVLSSLFISARAGVIVEAVDLGTDEDEVCRQESSFEVIDGLDGFAPRLYKVKSLDRESSSPSAYVMESLGPSLDPAVLLEEANRPLLYRAMASAIQAIERWCITT